MTRSDLHGIFNGIVVEDLVMQGFSLATVEPRIQHKMGYVLIIIIESLKGNTTIQTVLYSLTTCVKICLATDTRLTCWPNCSQCA